MTRQYIQPRNESPYYTPYNRAFKGTKYACPNCHQFSSNRNVSPECHACKLFWCTKCKRWYSFDYGCDGQYPNWCDACWYKATKGKKPR